MEEKPKSRPIMGKNALMIKTNLESDDSLIIKNIVMGKYSPTLQHYIDRMQQRRSKSKIYSEDTSTDSSISSNGFWFPNVETLKISFDSSQHNDSSTEETSNTKRRSYIRTNPSYGTHGHAHAYNEENEVIICSDEESKLSTTDDRGEDVDENDTHDYLEELKVDLAARNEVLFQVSKALILCKKSKSFVCSAEYLEAERILLITSLTKDALVGEINTIEFNNYVKPVRNTTKADLGFSNVEFSPKVPDSSIYLMVAICGRKVIASDLTEINKNDGKLRFKEGFVFKGLTTEFSINFLLYEVPVEVGVKKNGKDEPVITCNPLRKFFHFSNTSKKHEIQRLKPSAFKLRASAIFSPSSIPKSSTSSPTTTTIKLTEIPKPPKLLPELSLEISTVIHWETATEGFLTVGIEGRTSSTVWNRRWCRLDGPDLKYWNYPSEDRTAPLSSVDLRLCRESSVGSAGRDSCARPRTLLLVAGRNYFLCADDEAEFEMWRRAVDEVLAAMSIWGYK